MATQNLQAGRFLKVFPSDNADIPYPNIVESGTATSTSASKLVDTAATFITNRVQINDIIYNTTDSTAATVESVDSETQLTLNANIMASGEAYKVYQGGNNQGCLIYTGTTGNLDIENESGDRETFEGAAAGEYHPVHVVKVYAAGTTVTNIIALW